MPGLFGFGGDASQSASGGILGAAQTPQWANTLGLLSAGLKDASAQWTGHPADANALQEWQQTHAQNAARQQLLGGLLSDDPATRQQAYAVAPLFGVDPKAFQAQQAQSALPDLLNKITQPQSVTMPAVSGTMPNGMTVNAAPVTATGGPMTLSDALPTAAPELQSTYAPDIIKQQMEMQQKAKRTLSPAEAVAAGFKPGAVVQADNYGNYSVAQPSDVKSDAAVKQQIDIENQNPNLAIAKANLGVSQAHLQLDRDKQNSSLIDPLTRQQMAQQYLAGDPSVMTGLARGNPANIPLVRAEIQRQATQLGMKGGDIATKMAEFKGLTAGERALGTRTAQVGMASNEFAPMADQAVAAMQKLGPNGFLPVAKLEQLFQHNQNNPELRTAVAANNAVINTYARLINPNGTPTIDDKQHAREMLSTAYDFPSYQAVINQMKSEGAIAKQAPGQARAELGSLFKGQTPPALPPSTASLPRIQQPLSNSGWSNFRQH